MNPLPLLGLIVSIRRERCRYCGQRRDVATVRRGRDWWEQESLCLKDARVVLGDLVDEHEMGGIGA